MNIRHLELPAKDLIAQRDFYSQVLELPVKLSAEKLEVQVSNTTLVFTQANSDFDGAYHFAFNIPENQFVTAKAWISARVALLSDTDGNDEFVSESWNSNSVYFKDVAGNILEFIARHALKNASDENFHSAHILNVSEIGLPAEGVISLAGELCSMLGISTFRQEPNEVFTAVGDDNGLFIIPVLGRLWMPTHHPGVPAKSLPVRVQVEIAGKTSLVRGVPYEIK